MASKVFDIVLIVLRHVRDHIWRYVALVGPFLAIIGLLWPPCPNQEISYRLITRPSRILEPRENPHAIILYPIQDGTLKQDPASFSFNNSNARWCQSEIRAFEVEIGNTGKEALWDQYEKSPSLINVDGPFRLMTTQPVHIIDAWFYYPNNGGPQDDIGLAVTNSPSSARGDVVGWDEGVVTFRWRCWEPGTCVVLKVTYLTKAEDENDPEIDLDGRLARSAHPTRRPPAPGARSMGEERVRRWIPVGLVVLVYLGALLTSWLRIRHLRAWDMKHGLRWLPESFVQRLITSWLTLLVGLGAMGILVWYLYG